MKCQFLLMSVFCISGFSLVGYTASADESKQLYQELQSLKNQLQSQQKQLQSQQQQLQSQSQNIQQLRAKSGDSWMNQRRAEEVKALIGDVLADADTRASFASHGMTAGHNGGFFLASEDGNFLLRLGGQIQARYIYNDADNPDRVSGSEDDGEFDEQVGGFQLRRARLRFSGHVVDPRFTYAIQFTNNYGSGATHDDERFVGPGANDDTSSAVLEEAWAAYEVADGLTVRAGQFKAPFLREEAVDASRQLAVERSYTADVFTVDYTQGIGLYWSGDISVPVRAAAMIHDGSYTAGLNYDEENTDFAIAGRAEALLAGSWDQFDDFTSSSSGDYALMIGAGIDWEASNTGDHTNESDDQYDIIKWTADISAEAPDVSGLNGFIAVIGQHITDTAGESDSRTPADQLALVGQAGIYLVPDKLELFGRYEHLDLDGVVYYSQAQDFEEDNINIGFKDLDSVSDDTISLLTIGINYYLSGHDAKFTLDSVWALDPLPASVPGAGLSENDGGDGDNQWAIRAQFQLLF